MCDSDEQVLFVFALFEYLLFEFIGSEVYFFEFLIILGLNVEILYLFFWFNNLMYLLIGHHLVKGIVAVD